LFNCPENVILVTGKGDEREKQVQRRVKWNEEDMEHQD